MFVHGKRSHLAQLPIRVDGDEEDDVPHVLELAEYRTAGDAEYDSWLLLEALEADTLALEVDAMPQEASRLQRWRCEVMEPLTKATI